MEIFKENLKMYYNDLNGDFKIQTSNMNLKIKKMCNQNWF